jgi:hypothetical protein
MPAISKPFLRPPVDAVDENGSLGCCTGMPSEVAGGA